MWVEKKVMGALRDGIKRATDIYKPREVKSAPVLVCRTPYNKEHIGDDISRFVDAGYIVILQDVRGRYASEVVFEPHFNETADGVDMFEWAASQPWSNGTIGTFGGSYLGGTQLLPARENPPALKVMIPEVTFSDMYEGNTHPGGVKVLHDLRWTAADIVPDIVRRLRNDGQEVPSSEELPDVNTVLTDLPLGGHPMIKKYAPFYREWLDNPDYSEYWDRISPAAGYHNITAPSLNISGWYDIFIWSTLRNYTDMKKLAASETARQNQRLIIGPWTHMNFTGIFPERDCGKESSRQALDLTGIKIQWFDRWPKHNSRGRVTSTPVMSSMLGLGYWLTV